METGNSHGGCEKIKSLDAAADRVVDKSVNEVLHRLQGLALEELIRVIEKDPNPDCPFHNMEKQLQYHYRVFFEAQKSYQTNVIINTTQKLKKGEHYFSNVPETLAGRLTENAEAELDYHEWNLCEVRIDLMTLLNRLQKVSCICHLANKN